MNRKTDPARYWAEVSFPGELALPLRDNEGGSRPSKSTEELERESAELWLRVIELERRLDEEKRTGRARALKELAEGMTHQINNILFGIGGNIELIKMQRPDRHGLWKYLDRILDAVRAMAALNARLSAYAGSGGKKVRFVSMGKLVRKYAEQMRACLEENGIELSLYIPEDDGGVMIDTSRIEMATTAILENAAESIEGKGRITVETGTTTLFPRNSKNANRQFPAHYFFLRVSDTGKGMPAEVAKRIFEPFFTTKIRGRGLGMAAAYGAIEQHGGWIEVESEVGKGSLVTAYLPLAAND